MPERLDHVTVSLNRGNVTFNWNARQALMRRLQQVQSTAKIAPASTPSAQADPSS